MLSQQWKTLMNAENVMSSQFHFTLGTISYSFEFLTFCILLQMYSDFSKKGEVLILLWEKTASSHLPFNDNGVLLWKCAWIRIFLLIKLTSDKIFAPTTYHTITFNLGFPCKEFQPHVIVLREKTIKCNIKTNLSGFSS